VDYDLNYLFGYNSMVAPFTLPRKRDFFDLPEQVRAAVEDNRKDIRNDKELSEFLRINELKK